MRERREAKQWDEILPYGPGHGVTLCAPDGDIERTLIDGHGRRADHIVCAMAVSACPANEKGEEIQVPYEGYRIGFLMLVNRRALGMDLEDMALPPMMAQLIENFHAAMRATFGVEAVNEAGRILKAEKQARREAMKAEMVSEAIEMLEDMFRKSQRDN